MISSISTYMKVNKINFIFYLVGFIILGLSVNLLKASSLGTGAWDTVTINWRDYLSIKFGNSWVTIGMLSFLVSFILMIIVISYRKKSRYLLMLIPIFLVAVSIDFWNLIVFKDRQAIEMINRIILFISGAIFLPMGLTMVVKSSFPAFVFDELMLMFVDIFHAKRITFVRLGIEFTGIFIGAIFGYVTFYNLDESLGAVNIGSFLLAFTLAPIMTFYFKIFKVKKSN
ncbi:MAG: hypothetical protein RQ856_00815 [Candidatus Izemoplasmatales bacterium]|nr:hypothetical protein [Candidatus Izemoplasmatales bacterium]